MYIKRKGREGKGKIPIIHSFLFSTYINHNRRFLFLAGIIQNG